jgi:hypothetical protein
MATLPVHLFQSSFLSHTPKILCQNAVKRLQIQRVPGRHVPFIPHHMSAENEGNDRDVFVFWVKHSSNYKTFDPEYEVNMTFRNVGKYLPSDKRSHPKRLESSLYYSIQIFLLSTKATLCAVDTIRCNWCLVCDRGCSHLKTTVHGRVISL